MGILILLVPVTVLLGLVGVGAYFWALRNRQFDDLKTPALRILFEDDHQKEEEKL
ncbi:MAG: cbb3-type cytochrome oxidase assembly protein CcoS [Acidobacteria bacterium]|nr:cbb3-type cytochrome oxidase assembly protein CcoS [Acidobacteriota bacterium]MCB9397468.1 cbb3-type cytochrome oxidase assembly protein CcoS [Acidobacteriota bacterium]